MALEPRGGVPMSEPAQLPSGSGSPGNASDGVITPALRIQILATEHWSLLATRSLAWNEVWARGGMLLSALSGAIVALALVGQGTGFDGTFAAFGIAILPVVLFLGVTTYVRMDDSNLLEAMSVVGMNRIRHGYLEIAPDLEPYLVTSPHDDWRGVGVTMGNRRAGVVPIGRLLSATPVTVSVINAVLAGAIAGLVAIQVGLVGPIVVAVSVALFAVVLAAHLLDQRRVVTMAQAGLVSRFPGEPRQPRW
jgi:hypothetical protein